jgi:hypothetical protein
MLQDVTDVIWMTPAPALAYGRIIADQMSLLLASALAAGPTVAGGFAAASNRVAPTRYASDPAGWSWST